MSRKRDPFYALGSDHTVASVCTDEQVYLVEEKPDEQQQAFIDSYARLYLATFGHPPLGLHYLKELVVWLPATQPWAGAKTPDAESLLS